MNDRREDNLRDPFQAQSQRPTTQRRALFKVIGNAIDVYDGENPPPNVYAGQFITWLSIDAPEDPPGPSTLNIRVGETEQLYYNKSLIRTNLAGNVVEAVKYFDQWVIVAIVSGQRREPLIRVKLTENAAAESTAAAVLMVPADDAWVEESGTTLSVYNGFPDSIDSTKECWCEYHPARDDYVILVVIESSGSGSGGGVTSSNCRCSCPQIVNNSECSTCNPAGGPDWFDITGLTSFSDGNGLRHNSDCVWKTDERPVDDEDPEGDQYRWVLDISDGVGELTLEGDDVPAARYVGIRPFNCQCGNEFELRDAHLVSGEGFPCSVCILPTSPPPQIIPCCPGEDPVNVPSSLHVTCSITRNPDRTSAHFDRLLDCFDGTEWDLQLLNPDDIPTGLNPFGLDPFTPTWPAWKSRTPPVPRAGLGDCWQDNDGEGGSSDRIVTLSCESGQLTLAFWIHRLSDNTIRLSAQFQPDSHQNGDTADTYNIAFSSCDPYLVDTTIPLNDYTQENPTAISWVADLRFVITE